MVILRESIGSCKLCNNTSRIKLSEREQYFRKIVDSKEDLNDLIRSDELKHGNILFRNVCLDDQEIPISNLLMCEFENCTIYCNNLTLWKDVKFSKSKLDLEGNNVSISRVVFMDCEFSKLLLVGKMRKVMFVGCVIPDASILPKEGYQRT